MKKQKPCETCGKIIIKPTEFGITRWNKVRFCSRKCAARVIHIGQLPWCTGKKLTEEHKQNISRVRIGRHFSPATEIKKGQRIGIKTEFKKGQIPWNWKGDEVGYAALHSWIKRKLGKPNKCQNPKCKHKTEIFDWANKSGKYKRDLNDWIRLCRSCHRSYDNERKRNVQAIFNKESPI